MKEYRLLDRNMLLILALVHAVIFPSAQKSSSSSSSTLIASNIIPHTLKPIFFDDISTKQLKHAFLWGISGRQGRRSEMEDAHDALIINDTNCIVGL